MSTTSWGKPEKWFSIVQLLLIKNKYKFVVFLLACCTCHVHVSVLLSIVLFLVFRCAFHAVLAMSMKQFGSIICLLHEVSHDNGIFRS